MSTAGHPVLAPTTLPELVEAVRSTERLIAVGAGTKPRLSEVPGAARLCMRGLSGITAYEPSEFTFTALAGTPMREIVAALARRGQYLPFAPMLVEAGATLGGTVAAGLSGPGRFRYGGVRDFILGVRFVDGLGRLLRMGGKVVKNAAGFDLPKFFVGSLGRFGVLAEITFKVFPEPAARLILHLHAKTIEAQVKLLMEAASSRFEFEALDLAPDFPGVVARIAGPPDAIEALPRQVLARWPGAIFLGNAASDVWRRLGEFTWAEGALALVKVPLSPAVVAPLRSALGPAIRCHVSAGGNVAYFALKQPADLEALDAVLRSQGNSGMMLRGEGPLWLGQSSRPAIAAAVKQALDPVYRFPALDD